MCCEEMQTTTRTQKKEKKLRKQSLGNCLARSRMIPVRMSLWLNWKNILGSSFFFLFFLFFPSFFLSHHMWEDVMFIDASYGAWSWFDYLPFSFPFTFFSTLWDLFFFNNLSLYLLVVCSFSHFSYYFINLLIENEKFVSLKE